jgi:hypothetical protein
MAGSRRPELDSALSAAGSVRRQAAKMVVCWSFLGFDLLEKHVALDGSTQ